MPGERQAILIFGRWQEKAKARVMRVFLRQRRGLTALMALEDDVLDGQHAALPGGHRFKDDLRRKEKAHKHSDKWTRSQNATCRSPTGFEKVRLYTTAREDEESTIHNGHYCSLKHHLALVIGPNLLNLRRKWSGLQGCSRRIGCLSDGGVYSRCKSRLYRWDAVAACAKSARFRLRLYSQTIQLDSRTLGVRAKERQAKDSGMHALC